MTIQTAIDGYRLIADRTGKYAGQVGPFWCGEDGVWHDVWLKKTPPAAAKVGVLKSNFKEPLWGVANFEDYAQRYPDGNLTHAWDKMPSLMIAKCAEALALRKAFPQELSGILTSDEMAQAESPEQEKKLPNLPPKALRQLEKEIKQTEEIIHNGHSVEYGNPESFPFEQEQGVSDSGYISSKQAKRLFAIAKAANWPSEAVKELVLEITGQESSAKIPWQNYKEICETIENNPRNA
jgi:RecT family.